ncbi:MAG: hypothetical protein IPG45_21265 [Deltaproteobacteria bacterium]|jgi:hypothetical protein|nr:hypothetical protein [Deltaproteobacteria bacterium]
MSFGNAQEFFSKDLIGLIVKQPSRFGAARGTLAFKVKGEGAWTVRLGDLQEPVHEGFARDADVKIWFLGDAFRRFLDGTLASRPTAREVILNGDPGVLERFGRLLQSGNDSLSIHNARG